MADTAPKEAAARRAGAGYQFGAFKGVFTPSILTILGVIMYLRFGWVLGNVGLPLTLLIVTMATSITFITGLSLSALATNRKIEGGGAYFIISRSLGVEAGAAVGLPLFFAQALGISFYIAGFSESIVEVFPLLVPRLAERAGLSQSAIDFSAAFAPQLVGVVTLLFLTMLVYKSADLALKAQFVVMAIIFLSLVSFFTGSAPELPQTAATQLPAPKPFWIVFAVFFPAVTGIEAGLAMSGDLKDPAKSLPRGTIAAVLIGYAVYIVIPLFLTFIIADTGILRDPAMLMIMSKVARWGKLVILGVWAASLSSAMGALLGAPRTLQALARDRVVPRIFARGFGKGNDPRLATATAFMVGLAGILLGSLNLIAPLLSMFFLTSYGLLNISAGLEELTSPPSWRPKFRIHWAISLIGACGCFAAMFMINAGATFLAAFVTFGVYFAMKRRNLTAWWGDMRGGILMLIARYAIHGLAGRKPDERTWKPNILVLSGSPTNRWYLIELAHAIAQDRSFLTVASIVPPGTDSKRVDNLEKTVTDYLEKRRVPAIVKIYPSEDPLAGAEMLVKTYGYGPIAPNTVLLGETQRPENYRRFARLIRSINLERQNVIIVRESSDEAGSVTDTARIDLWWYGTQQNLGFMLALGYLLKQSSAWRDSALVLKSIVRDPKEKEKTLERLESFITKVRLEAQADVIVDTSADIFAAIRQHSQGAGLVFLGMRAPEPEETLESYSQYYERLLMQTEDLPPAALILAAEEMDFYAIFEEP